MKIKLIILGVFIKQGFMEGCFSFFRMQNDCGENQDYKMEVYRYLFFLYNLEDYILGVGLEEGGIQGQMFLVVYFFIFNYFNLMRFLRILQFLVVSVFLIESVLFVRILEEGGVYWLVLQGMQIFFGEGENCFMNRRGS